MNIKGNFKNYLRTYRLVNLIMIGFTQFIVAHFIVIFYDFSILSLISLSTISIALAGYWLNDIADLKIDIKNQKSGLITQGNKNNYKIAAYLLLTLGLSLALYISYLTTFTLFYGFLFAAFAVLIYALFLSKFKVIGNSIVSLLIALVVLLCFYVLINHMAFTPKFFSYKIYAVWLYAAAAFCINWLREIVKDIEDIEGDKAAGRSSLPSLLGKRVTSFFVSSISLLFTIMLAVYLVLNYSFTAFYIALLGLAVLFMLTALYSLFIKTKNQAAHISLLLKIALVIGLSLPIFY